MNARARFVGFAVLLAGCAGGTRVEPIDSPAAAQAGQSADPVLGLDPVNQELVLAWVGGGSTAAAEGWHVYFARSSDAGETWTTPVRVSDREGDVHPHGESSPRIVLAHGVIGIAWVNSVPAPGRRWPGSNVRFSRSTDGGRSWSPAITLNDDTASGIPRGHLFHGAALQGDSAIVVAWMD